MYSLDKFLIKGYKQLEVPNTFYKHKENHKHLAVLLPGMGYTCQMPLMYYTTRLLLEQEINVFQVEYDYSHNETFTSLPFEKQKEWLLTDVRAGLNAIFDYQVYEKVTIIGKSLGTLAMGHLLPHYQQLKKADAIWLTPLFHNEKLVKEILECPQRSLFITGSADSCYVEENATRILQETESELLLIENGNHSLEIKDNIFSSIEAMSKVLTGIKQFLNNTNSKYE